MPILKSWGSAFSGKAELVRLSGTGNNLMPPRNFEARGLDHHSCGHFILGTLSEEHCHPQMNVDQPRLDKRLAQALDAEGVAYCQWKGHWNRRSWAQGEGDIDLLVQRRDAQKFAGTLFQLGFKQVLPPSERRIPGVASFYGFDSDATRFVHVHAHYQLVLGHNLTMNYRLPVEPAILASAV